MKFIAWYLMLFTAIRSGMFVYGLIDKGITFLTIEGTIVPVLLIPVFVLAFWFVRGRVNKVLAWYAIVLFIAEMVFLVVGLIQEQVLYTF